MTTHSLKARLIAYWITTALTAFVFLSGGATELVRPDFLMKGMNDLGYPPYFVLILGVWKLLGGVVVLIPGTPRLKEWAYAGMVFDLTGAAASHAAVGETSKIAAPLIITGIVMASWALRRRAASFEAPAPSRHHFDRLSSRTSAQPAVTAKVANRRQELARGKATGVLVFLSVGFCAAGGWEGRL